MAALRSLAAESAVVRSRYRGCTFLISNEAIAVYAPDGRKIGDAASPRVARQIVKGYRKGS